ncbi:hypothetical protein [Nostoc parmelioides]|uniref:Uncharacterized protein n=1 Tax=Nostoc parmelioides FACHB-3921 TaxID=2692909 RepID=A0ABR8BC79_9NOSO|nr:hypothetical protein [Nostoc parmelioides]MBD2251451.1 hypothetical protein [Nostoc parmelioides FACHB-3921]
MNKSQAINLLENEGWTKADAMRALEVVDFKTNPDEITVRRAISSFAGTELINRQRLQAAQKGIVTKKNKEIERIHQEYTAKINQLNQSYQQEQQKYTYEIQNLSDTNKVLDTKLQNANIQNNELVQANKQLQNDNKALKNLIDEIRLKLAINTKQLLQYEDSELRKALIHMFKSTLG